MTWGFFLYFSTFLSFPCERRHSCLYRFSLDLYPYAPSLCPYFCFSACLARRLYFCSLTCLYSCSFACLSTCHCVWIWTTVCPLCCGMTASSLCSCSFACLRLVSFQISPISPGSCCNDAASMIGSNATRLCDCPLHCGQGTCAGPCQPPRIHSQGFEIHAESCSASL